MGQELDAEIAGPNLRLGDEERLDVARVASFERRQRALSLHLDRIAVRHTDTKVAEHGQ